MYVCISALSGVRSRTGTRTRTLAHAYRIGAMYALYVCLICMPYMYAFNAQAPAQDSPHRHQ